MDTKNDGGAAFPSDGAWGNGVPERGLTVRDYFASHCDQPGQAEIVRAAGLVWSNFQVWHPDESQTPIGPFNKWWDAVSTTERFRLYAMVRYQMADAMIKARGE